MITIKNKIKKGVKSGFAGAGLSAIFLLSPKFAHDGP
jgi:hypothetical protein